MKAGTLTCTIALQRKTVTQNSYGGDVETWGKIASYWANIKAMQGRELDAAQQKWAEARFKVTIRFRSDITPRRADRLSWGTRTLDILDAEDPISGRREVVLICRELVL